MRKQIGRIVVLSMVTLLVGCATSVGQKFDSSYVSKIERGVTTKADIRENIGEPHSITLSSQGEIWGYQHIRGGNILDTYKFVFGADLKSEIDALTISFEGNTVKDYSLTKSR